MYRVELLKLQRLQSDIMTEVDRFQSLLAHRMTLTSAVTSASTDRDLADDLGSLGVIHEVGCIALRHVLCSSANDDFCFIYFSSLFVDFCSFV